MALSAPPPHSRNSLSVHITPCSLIIPARLRRGSQQHSGGTDLMFASRPRAVLFHLLHDFITGLLCEHWEPEYIWTGLQHTPIHDQRLLASAISIT